MTDQSTILAKTIRTIGWSAIAISIIVVISESINLLLYNPARQLDFILQMLPNQRRAELSTSVNIFRYSQIWSVYTILYFLFVLLGAVQFIRFRASGRTLLEYAASIGILNACLESSLNFAIWKNLQSILSSVVGYLGVPAQNFRPFGILSIIGSFALWIVPSVSLIVYLRKPAVRTFLEEHHSAGTT